MEFKLPFNISILKKKYSKEENTLIDFFSKNYLFSNLKYQEIALFLPFVYPRSYIKKEAIFFRGDPCQALYIIKQGKVAIYMDIDGKFEKLGQMKNTNTFGDNAILPNARRLYNTVVLSDNLDLYIIPRINIQEIFHANVKIKAKMMSALALNYNGYITRLFQSYKDSFGFFDLSKAFTF